MKLTKLRSSTRRKGFTLIEIMVATVIMVIMVGLVIQITSQVLNVWNRSTGKLAANAEARIALDLLTSDLEAAVMRRNGQQWLRVEAADEVENPEQAEPVGQTVGLKMFTPALDNEDGGISGVAYRLAYKEAYEDASFKTFVLFRALASPQETFDNLLGPADEDPQLELTENSNHFWSDDQIEDSGNYLVGNVVDFRVFVYDGELNDDGEQVALNDTDEDREIEEDFIFGGRDGVTDAPTFFDVVLTVVSDEGLAILELPSLAGTGYEDPSDVVREHGQVFTRRIFLNAQPF